MENSTTEFQDRNETYPEEVYFRNCTVIGNLPTDISLDLLFSFVNDVLFCKTSGRKITSDLNHPHMKAVVLAYESEEMARLSSFRAQKALSRTGFTVHDGQFLFQHCKQMDQDCDPRSRSIAVSGFDATVPKDMYLDLFKAFGTVRYFEFCTEGDIPKARFDYTRVTSAFAALFSMEDKLGVDTLVRMEMHLFPVAPISPGSGKRKEMVVYGRNLPALQIISNGSMSFSAPLDEIREHYFMLCSLNTSNYRSSEERLFDSASAPAEIMANSRSIVEECSMGTVSFEISRRKQRERESSKYHPQTLENLDKINENGLRLILQAYRRKMLLSQAIC